MCVHACVRVCNLLCVLSFGSTQENLFISTKDAVSYNNLPVIICYVCVHACVRACNLLCVLSFTKSGLYIQLRKLKVPIYYFCRLCHVIYHHNNLISMLNKNTRTKSWLVQYTCCLFCKFIQKTSMGQCSLASILACCTRG